MKRSKTLGVAFSKKTPRSKRSLGPRRQYTNPKSYNATSLLPVTFIYTNNEMIVVTVRIVAYAAAMP